MPFQNEDPPVPTPTTATATATAPFSALAPTAAHAALRNPDSVWVVVIALICLCLRSVGYSLWLGTRRICASFPASAGPRDRSAATLRCNPSAARETAISQRRRVPLWHVVSIVLVPAYSQTASAAWPYEKQWVEDLNVGSANWRGLAVSSDGSIQTAASNPNKLWYSSDYGATWTEDTIIGNKDWINVAMSSSGAVQAAYGYSGVGIWTSADTGATWTYREPTGGPNGWGCVAVSGDGVHMTGTILASHFIWTSADSGASWTQRATSAVWGSVTMSSDGTVQTATRKDGNIWTSSDSGT